MAKVTKDIHRHAFEVTSFYDLTPLDVRIQKGPFAYCDICKCIPSAIVGFEEKVLEDDSNSLF